MGLADQLTQVSPGLQLLAQERARRAERARDRQDRLQDLLLQSQIQQQVRSEERQFKLRDDAISAGIDPSSENLEGELARVKRLQMDEAMSASDPSRRERRDGLVALARSGDKAGFSEALLTMPEMFQREGARPGFLNELAGAIRTNPAVQSQREEIEERGKERDTARSRREKIEEEAAVGIAAARILDDKQAEIDAIEAMGSRFEKPPDRKRIMDRAQQEENRLRLSQALGNQAAAGGKQAKIEAIKDFYLQGHGYQLTDGEALGLEDGSFVFDTTYNPAKGESPVLVFGGEKLKADLDNIAIARGSLAALNDSVDAILANPKARSQASGLMGTEWFTALNRYTGAQQLEVATFATQLYAMTRSLIKASGDARPSDKDVEQFVLMLPVLYEIGINPEAARGRLKAIDDSFERQRVIKRGGRLDTAVNKESRDRMKEDGIPPAVRAGARAFLAKVWEAEQSGSPMSDDQIREGLNKLYQRESVRRFSVQDAGSDSRVDDVLTTLDEESLDGETGAEWHLLDQARRLLGLE